MAHEGHVELKKSKCTANAAPHLTATSSLCEVSCTSLGDGAHARGFARASASRTAGAFALRSSSCPRRPPPCSTLSARAASRRCVGLHPRPGRCCANAPLCRPPASPMVLRARAALRGVLVASMARPLVPRARPQRLLLHLPLLSPGGDQDELTECVPGRVSCPFAFLSGRIDRPDSPGATVAISRKCRRSRFFDLHWLLLVLLTLGCCEPRSARARLRRTRAVALDVGASAGVVGAAREPSERARRAEHGAPRLPLHARCGREGSKSRSRCTTVWFFWLERGVPCTVRPGRVERYAIDNDSLTRGFSVGFGTYVVGGLQGLWEVAGVDGVAHVRVTRRAARDD